MIAFPNAKINIGLFVTQKRDDGYHNLETVFYPLKNTKDALEIVPSKNTTTTISLSGLNVAGNEKENLVWKAYELLKTQYGSRIPELDIFLHKTIPMGAGLGGGSADGAFMLKLLNDFCKLNISQETLITMSLALGSDCPFFLLNTPQFAESRGEKMTPLSLDLSDFEIKIITSAIHVSTKIAFSNIQPRPATFDLSSLSINDIENWKHYVFNDFETTVFANYPQLKKNKQQLYDEGAVFAAMSGTGSTVYGLFKKNQ